MGISRVISSKCQKMLFSSAVTLFNNRISNYVCYFHSGKIYHLPRALPSSRISRNKLENFKEEFPEESIEPYEHDMDVFGIESDKGAVYFDKKSSYDLEKYKEFFETEKSFREVTCETSFGKVRRDIDNPPNPRGTLRSNIFNLPSETTVKETSNTLNNISEHTQTIMKHNEFSESSYNKSFDQEKKFIDDSSSCDSISSESQDTQIVDNKLSMSNFSEESPKSSYFDECCFETQYSDSVSDSPIKTEISSINLDGHITADSKLNNSTENIINDNFSYIDNCYFGSENINDSLNSNALTYDNSVSANTNQILHKTSPGIQDSTTDSYIDECYFNNLQEKDVYIGNSMTNEINHVNQPQQHSEIPLAVNIIQEEKKLNTGVVQNLHDTSLNKNETLNSQESSNHLYRNSNEILTNETSNFTKFNFKFKVKSDLLSDSSYSRANTLIVKDTVKQVENNILNEPKDKNTENLKEKEEEEQLENPNNKSAIDYVLNLKKATKVRSDIIKDGSLSKLTSVKLDSKGFRVLKNQVPNLSKLTHEELLMVLKNRIIYKNDDVLILDKPYNLIVHEAKTNKEPSLSNFLDDLARHFDTKSPNPKLYTVHRLDKETTGCILLARNEMAADHLKALFVQRKIIKMYWVVTSKVPDPMEGIINIPIVEGKIGDKARMVLSPNVSKSIPYKSHAKHGKEAITHYRVLSISGNAALVEAQPKTGLKHQIRVHFGFGLGCPIIGDHKYSHLDKLAPQKLPSDLLQRLYVRQSKVRYIPMHIHARSIIIPELLEGRNIVAYAPLPQHMKENLRRLKFRKK